jgi:uroporphyrinogen decarboxylase
MERNALIRDFGSAIAFHGGMYNQHTLPFGTPDQLIRKVKENIMVFSGARWFCAPCRNIQNVTPVHNVIAMYQTIREEGAL